MRFRSFHPYFPFKCPRASAKHYDTHTHTHIKRQRECGRGTERERESEKLLRKFYLYIIQLPFFGFLFLYVTITSLSFALRLNQTNTQIVSIGVCVFVRVGLNKRLLYVIINHGKRNALIQYIYLFIYNWTDTTTSKRWYDTTLYIAFSPRTLAHSLTRGRAASTADIEKH